ncbi:MAG: FkbM family methyltransferase [Rhodospirillaceae bacterium]
MSVVAALRRLRHGPLRFLSPVWTPLGNLYRGWLARSGSSYTVNHQIGSYGPFRLSGEFAFSDFGNWGGAHNSGFEFCIEASRGKKCVLDIGAHIGLVALPLSQVVAPGGRVFAFEPAQANRETLLRHLEINGIGNVEVIDRLVGDADVPDILLYEHDGVSGMNTRAPVKDGDAYRETRHGQCSLDAFCRERGIRPDVIKIDVEGAEFAVLEGARDILAEARPLLVVSVHPQHLAALGRDANELHALAAASGYTVSDTDGNPVETFQLDEYVLQPGGG